MEFRAEEIEPDDVDTLIHDALCCKLFWMDGEPCMWLCVETCPVAGEADLTLTAAELTDMREAGIDDGE